MSIDELVTKYYEEWQTIPEASIRDQIRAALTEQAAEHKRKQALLLEAHCERVSSLQERIRELEAQRVPDGWKLVPVEPTDAMRKVQTWDFNRFYSPSEIWKAMLAAAPAKEGE